MEDEEFKLTPEELKEIALFYTTFLTPEEILTMMTPEQILDGIPPEQIKAYLEKIGVSP